MPTHNGFNLLRVYWYTLFWDNVTQILNSISVEVTLAQFRIQLMLPEQLQFQPQMFFMLFLIFRIYKNVIKENKNKLVQISVEDTIHKADKCRRWCICETKWYHYKLIIPIPCPEGCLMNVFILDSHLMVTRPQAILENTFAPLIWSKRSSILVKGYLLFTMTLFSCL